MENVENIVEMLLNFIKTTGESLLTAGFEIAVKYVIIKGTMNLIFGLIFLLVSLLLFKYLRKIAKTSREFDPSDMEEVLSIFAFFGGIISFIIFAILSYEGAIRLFAPEWNAILQIIGLF